MEGVLTYTTNLCLPQDGYSYLFYRTPVYLVVCFIWPHTIIVLTLSCRLTGLYCLYKSSLNKGPTTFYHIIVVLNSFAEPTFLDNLFNTLMNVFSIYMQRYYKNQHPSSYFKNNLVKNTYNVDNQFNNY